MKRAVKIRLDLSDQQASHCWHASNVARHAYNWALDRFKMGLDAGLWFTDLDLRKEYNAQKRFEFPWALDVTKCAAQQAIRDLGTSVSNWKAKRAGFPTFKHKDRCARSFYVDNTQFRVNGMALYLPKLGNVRLTEELPEHLKLLSVRISQKAGRWYASFQLEGPAGAIPPKTKSIIGVDLGIRDSAVTSDNERFQGSKNLRKLAPKLRRAQRAVSRKKKGSKSHRKAADCVARIHERIVNVRRDFQHKLTTRLTRESQAVMIEDLHVSGMLKNHCLARAIADEGFAEIRRQLTYKGQWYGCQILVANRWFPSSKACSNCACLNRELGQGDSVFVCPHCGFTINRDLNAAINLRTLSYSGNYAEQISALQGREMDHGICDRGSESDSEVLTGLCIGSE